MFRSGSRCVWYLLAAGAGGGARLPSAPEAPQSHGKKKPPTESEAARQRRMAESLKNKAPFNPPDKSKGDGFGYVQVFDDLPTKPNYHFTFAGTGTASTGSASSQLVSTEGVLQLAAQEELLSSREALHRMAKDQLAKELAHEVKDDTLPPIVPEGWSAHQKRGSRVLVMKRVLTKGYLRSAEGKRSGLPSLPPTGSSLLNEHERIMAQKKAQRRSIVERVMKQMEQGKSGTKGQEAVKVPAASRKNHIDDDEMAIDITIYAPFQSVDPSFYDPSIDKCEWVPFDVRVVKPDQSHCLFLRMASVNSELKIRYFQVLPYHGELAGETASISGGTAADGPIESGRRMIDSILGLNRTDSEALNQPLSCAGWSEWQRHQRELQNYQGPPFTDLPKMFQGMMMDYITATLGVDYRVAEFICQMGFHAEHTEYQEWLGKLQEVTKPRSS